MPVSPLPRRGRPPASLSKGTDSATPHRVEAVERALTVLGAFAEGSAALSLSELARITGITPSTILRLGGSLIRYGYLRRGADGLFRLGATPLRLGLLYRASFVLSDHVRPALARLAEATHETAAFYILEGNRRVCLFRHEASTVIRHHVEEGTSLPLGRGASAHILTAFGQDGTEPRHKEARRQYYAISLGERDSETAAIAAPVFEGENTLAGALSISGLLSRIRNADAGHLAHIVLEAAQRLTHELGGQWPAFAASSEAKSTKQGKAS
jgi:DNA-binding IclR family transcriptional regulator